MKPSFLAKLNTLRHQWGEPLSISSGVRCTWWNAKIGGAPRSQHLQGNAADIIMHPKDADRFRELAKSMGFGGVEVGKNFVHVDDGPERSWVYL